MLTDYRYQAKDGPLPFQADFVTEFTVTPRPQGCTLRVSQDGFPTDSVAADAFYAGLRGRLEKTRSKACGGSWPVNNDSKGHR